MNRRLRLVSFAFCLTLVVSLSFAQENESRPNDDQLLAAMRTELEPSKSQLKLENVAAPYYIEYRVNDTDDLLAEAAFGALRTNVRTRFRFVRVVVRIGDYKQDSFFGQGEGVVQPIPVDNEMLALRHQLWLATDQAYKAAAEALTAKQAQLKQYSVEQPVDDFARSESVEWVRPTVRLNADPDSWMACLRKRPPSIEKMRSLTLSIRRCISRRSIVTSSIPKAQWFVTGRASTKFSCRPRRRLLMECGWTAPGSMLKPDLGADRTHESRLGNQLQESRAAAVSVGGRRSDAHVNP